MGRKKRALTFPTSWFCVSTAVSGRVLGGAPLLLPPAADALAAGWLAAAAGGCGVRLARRLRTLPSKSALNSATASAGMTMSGTRLGLQQGAVWMAHCAIGGTVRGVRP